MKRKIGNSWGGGGVIHDPSGTEIPRGWRGLIGRTIRGGGGGYGYFLEPHIIGTCSLLTPLKIDWLDC